MTDRDLAFRILSRLARHPGRPEEFAEWTHATPLVRELVLTTIRHRGLLHAWTDRLCLTPPSKRVRPLIELGFTQLLLLDGVPPHAAVHETLETGKRAGFNKGLVGFINALFRRALREKDDLLHWRTQQPPHIRYSHPLWLVNSWKNAFGKDTTAAICAWDQQRSHTYVRRTHRCPEISSLSDGLLAPVPGIPDFYQVAKGVSPTTLEGFAEGAWYVQDPSTRLAPALIRAQPGERILDACAAPGGKTALLAEAMGSNGQGLIAADPNPKRVKRLRDNLQRLGLHAIDIRTAEIPEGFEPQSFDAVLLDVPCSNTGVLQRRPDAKWSLQPEQLDPLQDLQRRLLDHAAPLVKPGGRILYSTCSIQPGETTRLVHSWLTTAHHWTLADATLLLPGEQGCDGGYAARLERRA